MPTPRDIKLKVGEYHEPDYPKLVTSLGWTYTVDAQVTLDGYLLTVAHIDRGPAKCYVLLSGVSLRERESWQTAKVLARWTA